MTVLCSFNSYSNLSYLLLLEGLQLGLSPNLLNFVQCKWKPSSWICKGKEKVQTSKLLMLYTPWPVKVAWPKGMTDTWLCEVMCTLGMNMNIVNCLELKVDDSAIASYQAVAPWISRCRWKEAKKQLQSFRALQVSRNWSQDLCPSTHEEFCKLNAIYLLG